ncbi:hypothetical protein ACM66Z_07105 [Sulfurovum sp. ST-21]|uniref:Uncharacterized protein n=1 Tax=Sulfurovum indicum TaxID=2779528 RepID=A0A7M1S4E1_9BACT|nr:hypothetical protein [Sulfurovum indicum]QOR61220.1 hypothetical protein IMZ28_07100 [Sulfurovum indicum]
MGLKDIDPTPPYMRAGYSSRSSHPFTQKESEEEVALGTLLETMRERPWFFSAWLVYGGTAIMTFAMMLIDTLMQSRGFFSFIWQVFKGLFIGTVDGLLWPILLLFDMQEMWAVWFPFIGSMLVVYRLLFEQRAYRQQFVIAVWVYGMVTLGLIINYFVN